MEDGSVNGRKVNGNVLWKIGVLGLVIQMSRPCKVSGGFTDMWFELQGKVEIVWMIVAKQRTKQSHFLVFDVLTISLGTIMLAGMTDFSGPISLGTRKSWIGMQERVKWMEAGLFAVGSKNYSKMGQKAIVKRELVSTQPGKLAGKPKLYDRN